MIVKAMSIGAILGFIIGIVSGGGIPGAFGSAFIFAIIAIKFRKWIARTFWQ